MNSCITIYRDYTTGDKNQRWKKSFNKDDCFKNVCYNEDKNYLYRELMKIVECVEKPLKNSAKNPRKIYRTKKSVENKEDLNNSVILDENENKNDNAKPNKQKLYTNKKNILFFWYLEVKNNIENKCFDIEKEKIQFCKTKYNFN